ncbi:hypothetical protein ACEWY4_018468 [Coilia grayii]|uniref:CARD domain-containing protein n=1 Tax=Coilia grayii TaxID=363190 RepID=A0ABD1JDA5_9TELE
MHMTALQCTHTALLSIPLTTPPEGPGMRRTVKGHLLASQDLLVESLYNLAPLLDRLLACGLLSQDNYYEVKAETTPPNRARKLLEVLHAQMDEGGASCFLECLRRCKQHYPRLRSWLSQDAGTPHVTLFTEQQLQAQLSVLCARLGHAVLPVSLALFSGGTLTQYELEQVQAAPTLYQQAHALLTTCLSKGEGACGAFYSALDSEDENLATDIRTAGLPEGLPDLSVESESDEKSFPIAVEETSTAAAEAHTQSGVLQEVLSLLGAVSGEARLNVCELGVVLGLPRWSVRGALLEEVGVGDGDQLEALVDLFLQKTQDAPLLLSRVRQCNVQRAQLSERGCLLLKLLQEADALLHCRHFLQAGSQDGVEQHRETLETIFSFLLWDCVAQTLEVPAYESGRSVLAYVAELRGSEAVDDALLQELEECWRDGGAEALRQAVRVLAQILRDLHPLRDSLHLSAPGGGTYTCHSRRLHRVTRFQGLPARVIRKAGGGNALSLSTATSEQDAPSLGRLYRELCLRVARMLELVCPAAGDVMGPRDSAEVTTVAQRLKVTLSQAAFDAEVFDAGMKPRLLSLLEYGPARLAKPPLMQLHLHTLSALEHYLQQGEHHSFRFVLECVQMLGGTQLSYTERTRGPVAIDNGMEEVYYFVTSEPASFLVRVCCHGYARECRFEVCKPQCVCLTQHDWANLEGAQGHSEHVVLAEEGGSVWVREGVVGWLDNLQANTHRGDSPLHDQGCSFKVTSYGSECKVKFIYKNGRISASAFTNCEVL